MDVCLLLSVCVLSGRGLCVGLITRPEESYRVWCVSECDLDTFNRRRPRAKFGLLGYRKGNVCESVHIFHKCFPKEHHFNCRKIQFYVYFFALHWRILP
jgi:hypothetical protein